MDLQENIAGVHFDQSGIHGGTPACEILLVKSREEYAASLKCSAEAGRAVCMSFAWLLISC